MARPQKFGAGPSRRLVLANFWTWANLHSRPHFSQKWKIFSRRPPGKNFPKIFRKIFFEKFFEKIFRKIRKFSNFSKNSKNAHSRAKKFCKKFFAKVCKIAKFCNFCKFWPGPERAGLKLCLVLPKIQLERRRELARVFYKSRLLSKNSWHDFQQKLKIKWPGPRKGRAQPKNMAIIAPYFGPARLRAGLKNKIYKFL